MKTIYIFGGGAVGAPLACFLKSENRPVCLVRTRVGSVCSATTTIRTQTREKTFQRSVSSVTLDELDSVNGIIVITSKTYANASIASRLKGKYTGGPIILAQNGLNVEREFQRLGYPTLGRAVLYLTSEAAGESRQASFVFRPIAASMIGPVCGNPDEIEAAAKLLHTTHFPFEYRDDIELPVLKKAIINVIYNSICPLLEVDNGIFHREPSLASLVDALIEECLQVTQARHLTISRESIREQVALISQKSKQLISTLQDIQNARDTEMEYLNLEFLRIAHSLNLECQMPLVSALGQLIVAKSKLAQSQS